MIIPVLKKDETLKEILAKLNEEFAEVWWAIEMQESKEDIAGELLDVIQVAIGGLNELKKQGLHIPEALKKHTEKLKGRGWEFERELLILPVEVK